MRKVILFIAISLDGYIADKNGKVDWLQCQGDDGENIDSYAEFIKDVDTAIMGWNTYHQIVTELSPDEWVYDALTTYVVTHRAHESTENIKFVNEDLAGLIDRLRQEDGKSIWICGGANTIQQLVRLNMIDCYYITVIPTLLGSGIRLFDNGAAEEIKLKLINTQSYNGMTDLVYIRRDMQ